MSLCKQNSCHPNIRSSKLLPPLSWLQQKGTTYLQGTRLQQLTFLPLLQPPCSVSPQCPPAGISPVREAPEIAAHWKHLQLQSPW